MPRIPLKGSWAVAVNTDTSHWRDYPEGTSLGILWDAYAHEVQDYLARHAYRLKLFDDDLQADLLGEVFYRARRKSVEKEGGNSFSNRFRFGGVRFTFTESCIKYIQLERLRRKAEERRRVSPGTLLAVGAEDDSAPNLLAIDEIRRHAADDQYIKLAVELLLGEKQAVIAAYQKQHSVSQRTVYRHSLIGLDRLRRRLEADGYGPGR